MPSFLVEVFAPRSARLSELEAAARACALGRSVRYLESIHVPEDETCFHLFRAASAEAVRRAATEGALVVQRVVRAEHAASGRSRVAHPSEER